MPQLPLRRDIEKRYFNVPINCTLCAYAAG